MAKAESGMNPDNAIEKQAEFENKLRSLDSAALFDEAANRIWLSAYANNNPRSCYHWQADACYDECARRERPDIYRSAYRKTYIGCGHGDPYPKDEWCPEAKKEGVSA